MKLWRVDDLLIFECPGCGYGHHVYVNKERSPAGSCWSWNGSMEAPTFHPSILVTNPGARCHSFVTDGRIQFLTDCDHPLAGQTVDLPEVEH